MRGNHHDAWVNGAQDPGSGMSAELEEARALGELSKQGWRPKRTIVYAAWDGEEQGLLGSTEWVEDHEPELREKAAVYINTDGNGRGFLNAGGSHALEALVNGVARDIEDPETKSSVWKRMQARAIASTAPGPRSRGPRARRPAHRRARLGVRLLAVPAARRHRRRSICRSAVSTSRTASITRSTTTTSTSRSFSTPTSRTAARSRRRSGRSSSGWPTPTCCRSSSRTLADTAQTYVRELQALLNERQDEVRERNRQIEDGVFAPSPIRGGR